MQAVRRSIGQMPYRRRQSGLSAMDRRKEQELWTLALTLLTALAAIAINPIHHQLFVAGLALAAALVTQATAMRNVAWNPHAAIDKV